LTEFVLLGKMNSNGGGLTSSTGPSGGGDSQRSSANSEIPPFSRVFVVCSRSHN